MNIETVNELIASLESAGELSIREQKFLKLAKEFRICSASLDTVIKTGNVLADQNSQLAAENVALKDACGGNGSYRNCPACTFSEYIEAPETPATDHIVAGIKADGVEELADRLQKHLDEGDFSANEVGVIAGAIHCGREMAQQLREGADK